MQNELDPFREKSDEVQSVLESAKKIAKRYYELTGKPLGVTGEIGEFEAARLLNLDLMPAREPGIDAIERGTGRRLSIKARCLRNRKLSGRIGKIDITKQFDAVLLVLLDETMEAFSIYEAPADHVRSALVKEGSKSRNERGALAIRQFLAISKPVWSRNASH